jgi:hypothetical protein
VTNIRISPEAKKAIAAQFELLELSQPGIYLSREPPAADLSRTTGGVAVWKVERSQRCFLHFDELAPSEGYENHEQVVEGVRFWISRFRDSEEIEVEITTDNLDLFIDVLHHDVSSRQPILNEPSDSRPRTRSEFRLGLLPNRIIIDSVGENRLCLFYVTDGFGQDFHSLQWEHASADGWQLKRKLTSKEFQGLHPYRRWVAQLHSFSPATGIATIQVAEGDRPVVGSTACHYRYSWRVWDLQGNIEVKKLKDCKDPFEPPD